MPRLFIHLQRIFVAAILVCLHSHAYALDKLPSVFLESLTWMEVKAAIDDGYKTILIPTGGTEQNGAHMVLGKHNIIARHTSERIAKQLGYTLVAPVIAYVPEGNISPPEGHMEYAGTISLRPEIFSAVLEDTARSFKQHGFTRICFIGDSGGNQETQKQVTTKLNEEWDGSGVRVIHVSDYYSEKNGQDAWLKTQGYSDEEIKGHAALSDTSELSNIDQSAIRPQLLSDKAENGSTGPSQNALPKVGMALLNMKIDAAVKQIQRESK